MACVYVLFLSVNMLCVICRQKRNFRKHRRCLKSLMLTCKKSYHHYGQGKDVFVQVVPVSFRSLRIMNISYLVFVACNSVVLFSGSVL